MTSQDSDSKLDASLGPTAEKKVELALENQISHSKDNQGKKGAGGLPRLEDVAEVAEKEANLE